MTRSSSLQPICAVYGANVALRRKVLSAIIQRELAGGDPALNLSQFDGASAESVDVFDAVRTFSLLGGRRVVVVSDADSFVSRNRAALEKFANEESEAGCLILVCDQFDARTRLFKTIRQRGELVDCKPLKGKALRSWLRAAARSEYGKALDYDAAARLCDYVGDSQEQLENELAKLACYVGRRPAITTGDVDALVGQSRLQKIFAVVDAITDGDTVASLHAWRCVLETDRAAPARAVGGLAWGVRKLLDIRRRLDQGARIELLAKQAWTEPSVLRRRLARCDVALLERQLCDLLDVDVKSKSGLGDIEVAVEKLIVRHCAADSARSARRTG